MTEIRLRPTFEITLPLPADIAVERMRVRLNEVDLPHCSAAAGRCIDLRVEEEVRKVWSPHLSIQLEDAPKGSTLYGRYAPHPEVWTFFMFLYFAAAFAVLLGGSWGYAQWVSGEPALALWAVPAGLLVIVAIHLAGAVGRRLGMEQMYTLRDRLERLLADL
ncbi:MAG: hypothetical protein R3E10_12695 [Gemmatimonadota bacterium]